MSRISFVSELRRRNVVRVAIVYAVASWLILQLADVFGSLLDLPTCPAFKRFAREGGLLAYWRERGWPDKYRPRGDDFDCTWLDELDPMAHRHG